jgi:F0F1-type ATP synthase membrane subunit b/b'
MTAVAGKKLQDIYDSGADRLGQIEGTVSQDLKSSATETASERRDGDGQAQVKIEEKSKELELDLRKFKQKSIERLHAVIDEEVKETDAHLKQVVRELESLSARLKKQIAQLKETHNETVDNLKQNLADQFESAVEHSSSDLGKQDFDSIKHLRSHGTFVMNSLQQKLDHSLWESRGEEKQFNSTLFKTFMQKANSIDTHFSTLMQKLSGEYQKHYKLLDEQSEQIDGEIGKESEALLERTEIDAVRLEREIREFFNHELQEHTNKLDTSLNVVAQDLSTMHDTTTNKLTEQTQQLSAALVMASGEARDVLTNNCQDLREKVDKMMMEFKLRMDARIDASVSMKEGLEEKKNEIFDDLKKELTEIRNGFGERLNSLAKEATGKVDSVGTEAESEIKSVHQRCLSELKGAGSHAKNQVDGVVGKFVELIAEHRMRALAEIAKSAGVDVNSIDLSTTTTTGGASATTENTNSQDSNGGTSENEGATTSNTTPSTDARARRRLRNYQDPLT